MATRLNTRLILILVVAIAGSAVLIGGFAYLRFKADATRNVRQGDEFMAKGEYEQALTAYGRAVSKEPSNLQFVDKTMAALAGVVPKTRDDLRQKFQLQQQMYDRRIGIAPTRGETHMPLIELRHRLAMLQPENPAAWGTLEETAKRMAEQVDASDPLKLQGVLYGAIGALGRRQLLDNTQFEKALADLNEVIAKDPGNDLAHATRVRALVGEADRRRSANRNDPTVAEMADRAASAKLEASARVPDGPLSASSELQEVLWRNFTDPTAVPDAMVTASAERLLTLLTKSDDVAVLDRGLSLVLLTKNKPLIERGAEIARAFVKKHPEDVAGRFMLVEMLAGCDQIDAAKVEAEALLALKPQPVGLNAIFQSDLRGAAATKLFDLEFDQLVLAPPAEQEARRPAVEAALKRLRDERDEPDTDRQVIRSEGRLASALGRWPDALAKFERYIREVGEANAPPEVLFEAGVAAAQCNEQGLALRRIEQSLAAAPRNPSGLILKAQLEQRAGDREQAARTLSLAEQFAPDDPRIAPLRTLIQTTRGDDVIALQLAASQQRFDGGDIAGAKLLLQEALKKTPNEPRLLRAQAYMELLEGNNERAAELARAGLAVAPDDEFLQKALVLAENADLVERVILTVENDTVEGPDRVARTFRALTRVSIQQRAAVDTLTARGETEKAAKAAADADRVDVAIEKYRELAAAIQPPHPLVVRTEFDAAVATGKLAEAQAILDRQTGAGSALAGVELAALNARLLMARSDAEGKVDPTKRRPPLVEAAAALDSAIDRNPESTDLRVLRGRAQLLLGDVPRAVDNFEAAYQQRPNDMGVVEAYASSLQAAGEQARMLDVLREAAKQREVTPQVRSLWLASEAIYGDRRVSIRERRAIQAASPDDIANGVSLAALLMTLPPARELMLDSNGRERITPDAWNALPPDQQRASLDLLRREWLDEAERLLGDLAVRVPGSFEVAALRADLHRSKGQFDKGEQLLRNAVKQAGDSVRVDMLLALAGYLINAGKVADAGPVLDLALARQSAQREADRYLATIALQRGDPALAAKHLRPVAEASRTMRDQLGYAEVLGRSGQLDEADKVLQQAIADNGIDADAAMLKATLASQRLDAAVKAGTDTSTAERDVIGALTQAEAMRPTDPAPLVGQAQYLVGLWQRRPNRSPADKQLDEALTLLDRATALRADYWPAGRLRAQIFNFRGDATRARIELERMLKVSPLNEEARSALVDLWVQARAMDKAIVLAREGADLRPLDAKWQRMVGDLLDRTGNIPAAVVAHRKALDLDPSSTPERLVMLMLKEGPKHTPEHAAVVKLMQERPALLDRSAYLRAAYGAALSNAGKRQEGLEQLRQAYVAYGKSTKERPDVINGWFDQLWLVYPLDRTAEAETLVRELTGGKPSAFDLRELGQRFAETGPAGAARAAELLQQAATAAEGAAPELRAMIYFDLSSVLYGAGQVPAAIETLEKGSQLSPNNPGIHNNLAYLYVSSAKEPAKALPHAERAVAIAPGISEFHDTLGTVYEQLGRLDEAEREYKNSLTITETSVTMVNLARALTRLNRAPEARAVLRKASDLDPTIRQNADYKAIEAQLAGK